MSLTFKTAPIPTIASGREKEANPYAPHAEAAVKARGEKNDKGNYPDAKSIVFELGDKTEKYVTRKLREAAADLDVTIRVKYDDGVCTAWAVDRITREKKDAAPKA